MNILVLLLLVIFSAILFFNSNVFAEPYISDNNYFIEKIVDGLNFPTSMTFVNNEILVMEMSSGKIFKILDDRTIESQPIIEIPVMQPPCECGLLGITSLENDVYIFYSEFTENQQSFKNIVAKYQFDGEKLVNPIIIKEMFTHEKYMLGGAMTTGINNDVYFITGDNNSLNKYSNYSENNKKSIDFGPKEYHSPGEKDIGSIFKIKDNKVEHVAMGLRNSFGLAVDPLTGFLWQSENGPEVYDEINLITEKFNGGWAVLSGPSNRDDAYSTITNELDLKINFQDYKYNDPKFSFYTPVALTAIEFPNAISFDKYSNYIFVGDFNTGSIYKFQLNSNRDDLVFNDQSLKDLVYDPDDNDSEIIFASGIPGGISDIDFDDSGMYILSIFEGSIYKISSKNFVEEWSKRDLSGVNFVGADLSGADLSNVDLSGRDLSGVNFENANLSNVNFSNAYFSDLKSFGKYVYVDELTWMDFLSFRLQNMILSGFGIMGFELSGKELPLGIKFTFTDLSGPIFLNTTKSIEMNFVGADLSGADLSNVDLSGVNFENANLSNVNFSNAIMKCTNNEICEK